MGMNGFLVNSSQYTYENGNEALEWKGERDRGGMTRSKGLWVEIEPAGGCGTDRAFVHGMSDLPDKLVGSQARSVFWEQPR